MMHCNPATEHTVDTSDTWLYIKHIKVPWYYNLTDIKYTLHIYLGIFIGELPIRLHINIAIILF